MVHVKLKRTNYNYRTFKLNQDKLNLQLCLHGYYNVSFLYRHLILPYYFPTKTTKLELHYWEISKRSYFRTWF